VWGRGGGGGEGGGDAESRLSFMADQSQALEPHPGELTSKPAIAATNWRRMQSAAKEAWTSPRFVDAVRTLPISCRSIRYE